MDRVQTQSNVAKPLIGKQFIRHVLRANAIFSLASGMLFIFAARWLAEISGTAGRTLFGIEATTVFAVMGVVILSFAALAYYVSQREPLPKMLAWEIFALDTAWVIGSALLLLTNALNLTPAANWAVLIIGDVVLTFAILEAIGIRRYHQLEG